MINLNACIYFLIINVNRKYTRFKLKKSSIFLKINKMMNKKSKRYLTSINK